MHPAKLNKILSVLNHIAASILSYIVPKKKGYWVFVSLQYYGKYSGNTKELFEYFQRNSRKLPEGVKVTYVTSNSSTEEYVNKLGFPVKYNKLFWTWDVIRAELVITDSARSFLGFGRFRFIQLWHGTGYKNIGLAYDGKSWTRIRHFFLKQFFKKMILVCATSEADKQRKAAAFRSNHVVVTGSPRNDVFFKDISSLNHNRRRILYAPTFRDTGGKFSAMTNVEWAEINLLMEKTGSVFLVKRHPSDYKLQVPDNFSHVIDITDETEDIQTLLTTIDILITDYSGIASDFVITGKPIIFYTYDFDTYVSANRTFYYDVKKILPGPFVETPSQLIQTLEDLEWFSDTEYQNKYHEYRTLFHAYQDGKSSERVFNQIKILLRSENK